MGKPTFNLSPAMQFLDEEDNKQIERAEAAAKEKAIETPSEPIKQPISPSKAPKGYKISPEYIELKTKRVQIVLRPTTLDKLRKDAKKAKLSVNEYISRLIEEN